MTEIDPTLRELILRHVPENGAGIGDKALLERLAHSLDREVSEEDYRRVRDTLIAEGLLASGRGRGGSVVRAMSVETGAEADTEDDEPLLNVQVQVAPPKAAPRGAAQAGPVPRARPGDTTQVLSYRHGDKRRNNPHVGMVDTVSDGVEEETRWAYDPHIDPALQFDSARASIENLIDDALASGDEATMRRALEQLKRMSAPYLDWTGKAERTSFEVDTVSLHVHERIDPATILAAVQKQLKSASRGGKAPSSQTLLPPAGEGLKNPSPVGGRGAGVRGSVFTKAFQPDLFSAPFEDLPLREAIAFYRHERDWANRLVAGDSLLVMNSLLQKESMAGQVQMIYIDPPYGIKYGSNFQPFTNKRDVKDRKDEDLTQEPEMIKAFRDTWELGIHSYLTYLRDRLLLSRELLAESGSCFVQISDENLHHVREVMDEIFGTENFCSVISFVKTTGQTSELLSNIADYLVWYARDKEKIKFRQPLKPKLLGEEGTDEYTAIELADGRRRPMSTNERQNKSDLPEGARAFRLDNATSQRPPGDFPVEFQGEIYRPGNGYWKTSLQGFQRLGKAQRISSRAVGSTLCYVRFVDDFPAMAVGNVWGDMASGDNQTLKKMYVVQTLPKVIERCLLMTTDPGDLVLDPTCGSGATAFVAEKWGRRWITCDTSRVAVTLAKQRLLTAGYDYYELKYPHEGLKGGFIYKTVPHVTLKSIANNPEIDEIYERMHPAIEQALAELNAALQTPSPPAPLPPAGEGSESPSPAGGRRVWDEGAYLPNPPAKLPEDLKQHARDLRKAATDAENLMWQLLRNRRLANAKFRRQHPIGKYIADFYCDEQGLVIELDGGQHAEQKTYDDQRTAFLRSQGLTVLRFWNNQVLNETEAVLQVIWEHVAKADTLTPGPSPACGRATVLEVKRFVDMTKVYFVSAWHSGW
jgi:adenine-specific DNA-methyltransferase